MTKAGRNDPCPCDSGKKYKKCCLNSPHSPWGPNGQRMQDELKPKPPKEQRFKVKLNSAKDIKGMRAAGRLAAKVLSETGKLVAPGISTQELNDFAHQMTLRAGALSAPLGYTVQGAPPFPRSICTSVNNVVCHGIPSREQILKEGDIINIDITTKLNGYHGDTSRTFFVGAVDPKTKDLVHATEMALHIGIEAVKPGGCISDIGRAIQRYIDQTPYSIVQDLSGHGVGKQFHQDPPIFHFEQSEAVYPIKPGMTFTIEPMINAGSYEVKLLPDLWTIETLDGELSAQFEHTLLVTPNGVEILTLLE